MFGAVQCLSVLILTLLCVQIFTSVKVKELPTVCERAATSACHHVVVFNICLSIFPFDVKDKLWVLIRPVLGVS